MGTFKAHILLYLPPGNDRAVTSPHEIGGAGESLLIKVEGLAVLSVVEEVCREAHKTHRINAPSEGPIPPS